MPCPCWCCCVVVSLFISFLNAFSIFCIRSCGIISCLCAWQAVMTVWRLTPSRRLSTSE